MNFDFDNIVKKISYLFSDCDTRTCSVLLQREVSFIGNVQSETGKGSDNFGGRGGLSLIQSKILKSRRFVEKCNTTFRE